MLTKQELIQYLEKLQGVKLWQTRVEKIGENGCLEWYFEENDLIISLFSHEEFTNDPEQHFTNFTYQTILEIFQRFE